MCWVDWAEGRLGGQGAGKARVRLRAWHLRATALAPHALAHAHMCSGVQTHTQHARAGTPPTRARALACPLPNPQEVLAFLASPASKDPGAVLGMAMRLGEANFGVMALLDKGHTSK